MLNDGRTETASAHDIERAPAQSVHRAFRVA